MPTYEYKCDKCKTKKSIFTSISKKPESIKCEKCNIDMFEKYGEKVGHLYKGEGFYHNDYKKPLIDPD